MLVRDTGNTLPSVGVITASLPGDNFTVLMPDHSFKTFSSSQLFLTEEDSQDKGIQHATPALHANPSLTESVAAPVATQPASLLFRYRVCVPLSLCLAQCARSDNIGRSGNTFLGFEPCSRSRDNQDSENASMSSQ